MDGRGREYAGESEGFTCPWSDRIEGHHGRLDQQGEALIAPSQNNATCPIPTDRLIFSALEFSSSESSSRCPLKVG